MSSQPTQTYDVVIVGGGHAGATVATELHGHGFSGTVAIVNAEEVAPYERPPLSKAYLKGEATDESLLIRDPEYWRQSGAQLILGNRVMHVDPHAKSITSDRNVTLGFGSLVWAAGGSARRLGMPGEDLTGVHYLRTLEDARSIRASMSSAQHYVVVGGGFVGLEAAAVLVAAGIRVTVLEAQERLLARVTGPTVSSYFLRRHRAAGVDVRLNAQVNEITGGDGRVTRVLLSSGESISADHVLVAVGLVPSAGPLLDAGAAGTNCVEVDLFGRTTLDGIFAAGDCVSFPFNGHPSGRARLESIQNAVEQAKVVAASLVGDATAYAPQPWFWSNQYDIKLKTVGLAVGYDATVTRGDPASDTFSVVYLHAARVVAVDTVSHMRDYVGARTAVGCEVDVELLPDATRSLKDLIVDGTSAKPVTVP